MGFLITWFFSRFSPSWWYCKTVFFCPGSTVKLYFLSQKTLAKNPGQKSGPKSGQKSGQKPGHADHVLKTQLYGSVRGRPKQCFLFVDCFVCFAATFTTDGKATKTTTRTTNTNTRTTTQIFFEFVPDFFYSPFAVRRGLSPAVKASEGKLFARIYS